MAKSIPHPVEEFTERMRAKWDAESALYQRRGQAELAALMASIAEEVQSEAHRFLDQALTLAEAAEICGYSYSRLESLVRVGELPNAGESGRPRVRRRDLPRKTSGTVSGPISSSTIQRINRDNTLDDLVEAELLAREMKP